MGSLQAVWSLPGLLSSALPSGRLLPCEALELLTTLSYFSPQMQQLERQVVDAERRAEKACQQVRPFSSLASRNLAQAGLVLTPAGRTWSVRLVPGIQRDNEEDGGCWSTMTASKHLLHTCTNSRVHMGTHEQVHVVASSCHGAQSTAEVEKQVPCGPQAAPVWAPSARVCVLCPVAFVGLAWGYTRQCAGVILGGLRGAYEVLGIELESVVRGKHARHCTVVHPGAVWFEEKFAPMPGQDCDRQGGTLTEVEVF